METRYKFLEEELLKRGIKKKAIAKLLGITERTFLNKLKGITKFGWDEAAKIHMTYFLDIEDRDDLFVENDKWNKTA